MIYRRNLIGSNRRIHGLPMKGGQYPCSEVSTGVRFDNAFGIHQGEAALRSPTIMEVVAGRGCALNQGRDAAIVSNRVESVDCASKGGRGFGLTPRQRESIARNTERVP